MLKSRACFTMIDITIERIRNPLVPVTVTVYEPRMVLEVVMTVRVEVWDDPGANTTLVGVKTASRP